MLKACLDCKWCHVQPYATEKTGYAGTICNHAKVEVVKKAKQGDQQAFSELVNAYSERIYNLGLRILRKKEDAEDILQETFLTVIQKIDTFDGRSSFFTWIYRIATNTALIVLLESMKTVVLAEFASVT